MLFCVDGRLPHLSVRMPLAREESRPKVSDQNCVVHAGQSRMMSGSIELTSASMAAYEWVTV